MSALRSCGFAGQSKLMRAEGILPPSKAFDQGRRGLLKAIYAVFFNEPCARKPTPRFPPIFCACQATQTASLSADGCLGPRAIAELKPLTFGSYCGWTKSISHYLETMVERIACYGIYRGIMVPGFLNGGAISGFRNHPQLPHVRNREKQGVQQSHDL